MALHELLQLPVVTLVRVLGGMLVAFAVVPAIVLPRPRSAKSALDATVVRSVRWIALVLVVSQLLLLVRLFHVLPILLLCAWATWLRRKREGRLRPREAAGGPFQRAWLWFTDLLYAFERFGFTLFPQLWRHARLRAGRRLGRLRSRRMLLLSALSLPIAAILMASLGQRVSAAFRHETLSPPEAYVYLTWAKSVAANRPFPDGMYPPGLPTFIAFAGKLTPGIDIYEIVRYTGALIGMLLVFGLFYACLRLTANVGAALVASGTFGLFGTSYYWHAPWVRQTGPLPPELGFALALLALPSAVLAVTERDPDHLRTTLLAAVAIGLIHPVPLAAFALLALAGALTTSLFQRRGAGPVLAVGGALAIGAGVAHLYLPIGFLLGQPLFRGLDNPFSRLDMDASRAEYLTGALGTSAIGHTPLSVLSFLGAGLALLAAWLLARRSRPHLAGPLAGLGGMGLAVTVAYDLRWLDLPLNVLGPMGNLTGIATALGLGAGFAALTAGLLVSSRILVRTTAVIVLAALGVGAFGVFFESGPRTREPSEYESMAAVTREIMKGQDAFSYTIVGTPQQRQAVTGIGTFVELWVFARDVTVRDARDPGFVVPDLSSLMFARDLGETLPIPTADVYIFVEKVPFPVTPRPVVGPAEEYYHDPEKRGRIMATVYAWAEFYRHYHTDMDVIHEDDEIVVYRIRRRPNTLQAAASPQFKDYTWEPGMLFNAGPASPAEVVIPWHE